MFEAGWPAWTAAVPEHPGEVMGRRLGRWLREPLLHFLVAGAALFALASWTSAPGARPDDRVVVTAATIERLADGWTRLRLRPPTGHELEGLIEDHIREEIMYREALALGLDRDDTIIRRRLRQKLEFVSEDLTAQAEPSERQLEEYLAKHVDTFRLEPRFTFIHVFLNPSRRGAAIGADAARLLAELNRPGGARHAEELGDPFLLAFEFHGSQPTEIARLFGDEFAASLQGQEPGVWRGPIQSGYGAHLVLVRERIPGRVPALAEVRESVRREWESKTRRDANEAFFERLRSKYTVHIDRPTIGDGRRG